MWNLGEENGSDFETLGETADSIVFDTLVTTQWGRAVLAWGMTPLGMPAEILKTATSRIARRTGSATSGAPPPGNCTWTRTDAETLEYAATVTDPTRFAQPWTVRFTLSADQSGRGVAVGHLFEFTCHEGNYAIVNVLRGARVEDSQAAGGGLPER